MPEISAAARLEMWRRRLDRMLMVVPYGALICSTALVPIGDAANIPHQPYPVIAVVVVIAAAWMLWWVTLHPSWENDRRKMLIFFTGLVVLSMPLSVSTNRSIVASDRSAFIEMRSRAVPLGTLGGRIARTSNPADCIACAISRAR